ncbi:hypothetical protein Ancab_008595 [Ancistrocladus abbreviatus]
MLPNLSESKVKISWRDALVSQSFEVDEADCCRLFSDEEEEEDIDAYGKHFDSLRSPILPLDKNLTTLCEPTKLVGGKFCCILFKRVQFMRFATPFCCSACLTV